MGTFYVNHTVRAPQPCVVAFLEAAGRQAFVSLTVQGYTVVCDRQCDEQDPAVIAQFGRELSSHFEGPVLAVLNHNDDLLCYWLFDQGRLIEEYDSFPDYFDPLEEEPWRLWDDQGEGWRGEKEHDVGRSPASFGQELCRVFGRSAFSDRVQAILSGRDAMFALQIHQDLADVLGLPGCAVGAGYRAVVEREADLDRDQCAHVGRHVPAW